MGPIDFNALQGEVGATWTPTTIGDIIVRLLPYIFFGAGALLLLMLISAGYKLMTAAGDPKALQQAKSQLTSAFIGFFIVFVAYFIVQAIGLILGLGPIINIF